MKITPTELKEKMTQGNVKLLDVRSPIEFEEVHIEGSELMPLDRLDAERIRSQDHDWVLICRSGKRAENAQQHLQSSGCKAFKVLDGGVSAWEQAGLPVKRGAKSVSLERQVRIAAGLLVLISVILGTWLHSAIYGLAAFVGAGLIFAGITDWCGMGMLLARAPWNQRKTSSASSKTCNL